jgi:ABC-type sugar transport system substrate-binding protein
MRNPYFVASIEGAQAFADKYGHDLTVIDGASSAERQASGLENLIGINADAIDIRCVDSTAIKESVKLVHDAGIDISTYPPIPYRTCANLYDDYNMGIAMGTEAAKWAEAHWGGEAVDVAVMTQPTVEAVMQRRNGFVDTLLELYPNANIVQESDGSNPDDAMTATESILQAHPNVKMILCVNDSGALGAYEAVMSAGKGTDDFFIAGVDGEISALQKVAEGGIYRCSVATQFMIEELGYGILMNVSNAAQGKEYIQTFPVLGVAVTIDNIDQYIARAPNYEGVEEFLATYQEGRIAAAE